MRALAAEGLDRGAQGGEDARLRIMRVAYLSLSLGAPRRRLKMGEGGLPRKSGATSRGTDDVTGPWHATAIKRTSAEERGQAGDSGGACFLQQAIAQGYIHPTSELYLGRL